MTASPQMQRQVAALLAQVGREGELRLLPLAGGANNRVHLIRVNGWRAVVKRYFQDREDPRDRLGTEYDFLSFAWEQGLRCLPRPLARDDEQGLALYQFRPGRRLTPGQINAGHLEQVLGFILELNRHREHPRARRLPPASEACFSLEDHLGCLARRLAGLESSLGDSPADRAAARFLRDRLLPAWRRVEERVRRGARRLELDPDEPLPRPRRCLSPSDFGFHNILAHPERGLSFLDFEYAGWDDPVKMVCELFAAPAAPAPVEHFPDFARRALAGLGEPPRRLELAGLLLPLHRLKWVCIIMNAFTRVSLSRRAFAGREGDREKIKRRHLERARRALAGLPGLESVSSHGLH